ncbi:acyltransferase family protein [Gordonia terrae]|uniref:acyltransferase family protein n=1 Tax=Gordonia terrae TaxID=2055 RepID=UPI003F6CAABD
MTSLPYRPAARSVSIDLLRVFGIVAIIAGHVWDNQFTREGIYTWHVPLFFFLTGYLWTQHRAVRTEARKRARTLLVPYACWLALISIPYLGQEVLRDSKDPWPLLLNLLWGGSELGRPFSAFWFVTALFFAVILLRSLQRLPRFVPWTVSICVLIMCYLDSSAVSALPLSAGVAVPAMLFILLGSAFRSIRSVVQQPLWIGTGLLVLPAILVGSHLSAPMDMKQADFGTPVLSVLVAASIACGLVLIAETTVHWAGRAATWTTSLAATGLMVVLTHAAILWLLRTPPTGSWIDFALALTAPWLTALLLFASPLSPYLVGTTRRSRHRLPTGRS